MPAALLMALLLFHIVPSIASAEFDLVATVASVHDGDTLTLTTGDKVRLADLDAPELGEEGAEEARDLLASLVLGKLVFLDVDNKHRTDAYGRLVCVAYVGYNSTHLLNVNKLLIDGGYAQARDYDNEFDYRSFMLYVLASQGSYSLPGASAPAVLALVALALAALLAVLIGFAGKERR